MRTSELVFMKKSEQLKPTFSTLRGNSFQSKIERTPVLSSKIISFSLSFEKETVLLEHTELGILDFSRNEEL
jgi:hypothetical protein